jgi:hypothetical protein
MVSLDLPLIEGKIIITLVSLEFMSPKQNSNSFTFNLGTLVKSKTSSYSISLPIINLNKEVIYSNSVFLRNICSRIGEAFLNTIEVLKQNSPDDAFKYLQEAKYLLESVINNHLDFLRVIDLYNTDDSIIDLVRQFSSINRSKMLFFTLMLITDINETIEKLKNKEINLCDLYAIKHSLMFYRPVNLSDERFLEDTITI